MPFVGQKSEFRVPGFAFRVEDPNPPRRNRRGYTAGFAPIRGQLSCRVIRVFSGPKIGFRVPCLAKASAAAKAMADKSQGRSGSAFRVVDSNSTAPSPSRLRFRISAH